jgi:hypothetical protein
MQENGCSGNPTVTPWGTQELLGEHPIGIVAPSCGKRQPARFSRIKIGSAYAD